MSGPILLRVLTPSTSRHWLFQGLTDFNVFTTKRILEIARIVLPAVKQVEIHPYGMDTPGLNQPV